MVNILLNLKVPLKEIIKQINSLLNTSIIFKTYYMKILQIIFISLVAFIHIYIVYLEMVVWTSNKAMKAFGIKSKEFAEETKPMAANQGLYNGFIVAGLIWSLIAVKTDVAIFFLSCVAIAGLYGSYSIKIVRILYIQTIPAVLGILSILIL